MSHEPARTPLEAPERDVLDRLMVRVPALAGWAVRCVRRIPPGSSLRRRLTKLQAKRAFAAMARSDVEVVLLSYEPDAEVWMKSMSGVGISDCYRGYEGIRTLYADLDEAFEDWGWTLDAVVDGGHCLAVRGDFVGYGRGSGVKTTLKEIDPAPASTFSTLTCSASSAHWPVGAFGSTEWVGVDVGVCVGVAGADVVGGLVGVAPPEHPVRSRTRAVVVSADPAIRRLIRSG